MAESAAHPPSSAPRLGEQLLRQGLITPDQIEVALHEQARTGKMLGAVLVGLGFIKESDLNALLSSRSGAASFDPGQMFIDPDIARTLPRAVAERHRVALIAGPLDEPTLAMADPYDIVALDAVRRYLPPAAVPVPVIISASDLADAHDFIYGYALNIDAILHELRGGKGSEFSNAELTRGLRHPIVRLVNLLMLDAVKVGASDIHFEPEEYFVRIRIRIDGVLQQIAALHKDFWSALSHRLKIMAGMNIADKIQPQDGRFTMTLSGRTVDFRVASLPGAHGENIAVRVLDQARALRPLGSLGFTPEAHKTINAMLDKPEGLVIVTGPTGSGKTTTLYAALQQLASIKRNIMTLEDPIEYKFPLIRQTQIREATGLTFAEGIRAILRQDPDIILVGEIRDPETAQMALRAAMTGHLVLTTLHTRDVLGVLPRLYDLGLSPATLAGNLNGLVAQRLVRCLCDSCKVKRADGTYGPQGCDKCRDTGYRGRIPIAETVLIDEKLDDLIATGANRSEWLKELQKRGYSPLRDEAAKLVKAGFASHESARDAVDMGETNHGDV